MESITPPTALRHEEPTVAEPLRPFVIRRMHTWSDAPVDFQMPLPPTGSIFLTLVYGDPMTIDFGDDRPEPAPFMFIGGQLRRKMPVSRIQGRVGVTGFEFRPTGFHRLFHQDCQAFTDRATPLDKVVPEEADTLEASLRATDDIHARMRLLQDFLLARVPGALPATTVDQAVTLIEQAHGCITVQELTERLCLGRRQLHRLFIRTVGIAPKHFAKIIQIKQAIMTLQDGTDGELQALAQRTGYFDQAHFIHDFQRMIGTNPMAFLQAGNSFLRTYMHRRAD